MSQIEPNIPATVPAQPEAQSPVRKGKPVVLALIAIVALIGIANLSSLVSGRKKSAPASALTMRPSTANAQQVSSFETQQQQQVRHDAEERLRQQELANALQQLETAQSTPGPEADSSAPMTGAQRQAIYGESPNAPTHTSNVYQAQAEAKQKALLREKLQQEALNSATVAIDFAHPASTSVESSSNGSNGSQGIVIGKGNGSSINIPAQVASEHTDVHVSSEQGTVPIPNVILNTSPGKYQVLWRVRGFDFETQEQTLKALALAFGGDPACTDCNRVLRIPGYLNCKYQTPHVISAEYLADDEYDPENFAAALLSVPNWLFNDPANRQVQGKKHSNSEGDWAWVLQQLSLGTNALELTRELAAKRFDKPNPL